MPSLRQGIANLSIQIVNFGCFRFAIIMVNHYDGSVLFVSVNLTSVALVLLRLHVDVSFLDVYHTLYRAGMLLGPEPLSGSSDCPCNIFVRGMMFLNDWAYGICTDCSVTDTVMAACGECHSLCC